MPRQPPTYVAGIAARDLNLWFYQAFDPGLVYSKAVTLNYVARE